jgi:hypothetical protein
MSIHLHKQLSLFAGARLHTSRSGATALAASVSSRANANASANAGQSKQLYWPDRTEQTVHLADPDTEQSSFRPGLGVAY